MFVVLIKMFVVGIGYRILRTHQRQNFIQSSTLTKIVSMYFVFQLVLFVFLQNIFAILGLTGCFLFCAKCAEKFLIKRQEMLFHKGFPDILTCLILHMKMGKSFRQSLQTYAADESKPYARIMMVILEHVVFSQQEKDKKMTSQNHFLREIMQEFTKIDQSSHKSIEKLENFRRRLIILQEFRRRSGRIRGQVQFQAYLIALIYGICFAVMSYMFPLFQHLKLVLLSISFFLTGFVATFLIGRRIDWKI